MAHDLLERLDDNWQRLVENVRQAAARLWNSPVDRYALDHGPAHADRVVNLLGGLCEGLMGRSDHALTTEEIYVLLAATHLHAIGLQDEQGEADPRARWMRYPELGAERIYQAIESPEQAVQLGLVNDPTLIELVALVVQGHCKTEYPSPDYDGFLLGNAEFRPRLLTALLCLADGLDLDCRRVDLEQLKLLSPTPEQALDWWLHYYVSGVQISDENVHIGYRVPKGAAAYKDVLPSLVEPQMRTNFTQLQSIFRPFGVKLYIAPPTAIRPMRAVKPMPAEVWAEAERRLAVLQATQPDKPIVDFDPDALRYAYLSRLTEQTCRLPLAGTDPKAAEECGELQLSAVYTALLTQRPEISDEEMGVPGERRAALKGETRHLSALELLDREPRLVLLGGPGSGKSTFVNFVGLCLAGELLGDANANLAALTAPLPGAEDKENKPQPWNHGALLPVRIVLRDLAARGLPESIKDVGTDTLWQFIVSELQHPEYAPYLRKELLERGGLILLDGLDEVPDAYQRRLQVKRAVQGFAAGFPKCRFLVTCRTYAYQRQDRLKHPLGWKLDGFDQVILCPFSKTQIDSFIDRWYAYARIVRDLRADTAQGQAVLLKTAIERSSRLAELASRPLLLTLMAGLHAWRGGNLPEKREELYADAVDLLLERWEGRKVERDVGGHVIQSQPSLAEWMKVDRAVVRAELERLAFQAHRDQPELLGTADISQERLVSALLTVMRNPDVNPARLVEYIRDRAGLLAARGVGVYTFPHRTFQEYLAACHLTEYDFPDELARLLRNDPQRWREAVLLAGAKAGRGSPYAVWGLAEALCSHDPPAEDVACPTPDCWGALLAAETLLENERNKLSQVSERNAPKLEKIRRWLLAIVSRGWLPPVDRALAGQALAVLGDDRDLAELVAAPAGSFMMGTSKEAFSALLEQSKEWEWLYKGEIPQHRVNLSACKIGKYPITNAQFTAFVQAGGYREERYWLEAVAAGRWQDGRITCSSYQFIEGDWKEIEEEAETPCDFGHPFNLFNHPVVGISWYEARAYCRWLTEVWRAKGMISPDEVVCLPTEAQWEKAARGSDGRVYAWGDEFDPVKCNTGEGGIGSTSAVGMFPSGVSPCGALDMCGNVFEWVNDWYQADYYKDSPTDDPPGPESGKYKVLRGGSWGPDSYFARVSYRRYYEPPHWDADIGFRVVVLPGV